MDYFLIRYRTGTWEDLRHRSRFLNLYCLAQGSLSATIMKGSSWAGKAPGGYAALRIGYHTIHPTAIIAFAPQTRNITNADGQMLPWVELEDLALSTRIGTQAFQYTSISRDRRMKLKTKFLGRLETVKGFLEMNNVTDKAPFRCSRHFYATLWPRPFLQNDTLDSYASHAGPGRQSHFGPICARIPVRRVIIDADQPLSPPLASDARWQGLSNHPAPSITTLVLAGRGVREIPPRRARSLDRC